MKRSEYLQLLSASKAFMALSKGYQNVIQAAGGEVMDKYAAIYIKEKAYRRDNAREFLERTDSSVKGFNTFVKTEEKGLLKNTEKTERAAELAEQEDILNQI